MTEFAQTGREAPFEEIVRRYAGMVYHVCLEVTRNSHDAEDATQAVFLTLAAHAKTTQRVAYLGRWLQKVARRTALDVCRSRRRRSRRERVHADVATPRLQDLERIDGAFALEARETQGVVRDELSRLPPRYATPLMLHYFGGMDAEALSRELKCNRSTLGVRLHRGRKMLAERLRRRGLCPETALGSPALALVAPLDPGPRLAEPIAHAARLFAGGGAPDPSMVSASVLAVMRMTRQATLWVRIRALVAAAAIAAGSYAGADAIRLLPEAWRLPGIDVRSAVQRVFEMLLPSRPIRLTGAALPPESVAFAHVASLPQSPWTAPAEHAPEAHVAAAPRPAPASVSAPHAAARPMRETMAAQPPLRAAALAPVRPSRDTTEAIGSSRDGAGTAALERAAPRHAAPFARAGALVVDGATEQPRTLVIDRPLIVSDLVVGRGGAGRVVQAGGSLRVDAGGALTLGEGEAASGRFELRDGDVIADRIVIGGRGAGEFVQVGGEVRGGEIILGDRPGSRGEYTLSDGALALVDAGPRPPVLMVGNEGEGTLRSQTRVVEDESVAGADLVIRAQPRGWGELEGYGAWRLRGALRMNGRVVADGFGRVSTLDLSTFQRVANEIENEPDGYAGWFARARGALRLPAIDVEGDGTYTWGESADDPVLDLINSVRFKLEDVSQPGWAAIELLADDHPILPRTPEGERVLAAWMFDRATLSFSDIELLVRYDDRLLKRHNATSEDLRFWVSSGSYWYGSTRWDLLDSTLHLIGGDGGSRLRFFAVSATTRPVPTPEPALGGAAILAACAAMGRRRERSR